MFIVDLNQDKAKDNKYFSNTLLEKIEKNLEKKKKIILYLNKRWDYSSLICNNCSNLFKCKNCDTSMSVHDEYLVCHICNYIEKIEKKCIVCNSDKLHKVGVGTWQIEKYLKDKFKKAWVFRFDTDIVKNKKEKEKAIKEIEKADIIIGTKMITTWFDIEEVGLVGIILLEQELQNPKYDISEKVYSNLKQVLGRWGRKWEEYEMVIQSFIPENELIKKLILSNYKDFLKDSLEERKKFNYPPYKEYVILEYRNKNKEKSKVFIEELKLKLDIKNENKNIEIIKHPYSVKKNNQFYSKIILKWNNLRDFLTDLKKDLFKESNLSIIFE